MGLCLGTDALATCPVAPDTLWAPAHTCSVASGVASGAMASLYGTGRTSLLPAPSAPLEGGRQCLQVLVDQAHFCAPL